MKHIKTFTQLNETQAPLIQDPSAVMSKEAFEEASKLRSMVNTDLSTSVENPVYFVVAEDGDKLTVVIDEKFEIWLGATPQDRAIYYEEIIHADELEDYTIQQ